MILFTKHGFYINITKIEDNFHILHCADNPYKATIPYKPLLENYRNSNSYIHNKTIII